MLCITNESLKEHLITFQFGHYFLVLAIIPLGYDTGFYIKSPDYE